MCKSITYIYKNVEYTANQGDARPMLPVRLNNGKTSRILWGRGPDQPGELPFGYTVPLTDIRAGKWAEFAPRPLLVPFKSFTIDDRHGQDGWGGTADGNHIQALLATLGRERRLYIVTIQPDLANQMRFEHWPRTVATKHLRWDEKQLNETVNPMLYRVKLTPPAS